MDKERLKYLLKKEKRIPDSAYSLAGEILDDKHTIINKDGKFYMVYSERGENTFLGKFDKAEEAYDFMYNELVRMYCRKKIFIPFGGRCKRINKVFIKIYKAFKII